MDVGFEDVGLEEREDGERRVEGASPPAGSPALGPTRSQRDRSAGAEREEPAEQKAEGSEGRSSDAPIVGGSIVGDVLYSIATGEEEGKSRARILAFAAKRYQTAVDRNPKDYDALYNWALVLQESADNCGPEVGLQGKDGLLEEACKKYQAATDLCSTLHEAFYNWAIAISDRAKIRGRTAEAEELWKQACDKYEKAVQLNWDSPQALNNWGLALQELGNIVAAKEKRAVIRKAINKFRAAIRLRYDFHRAIYNLGTVLYGLAEDTAKQEKRSSSASSSSLASFSSTTPATPPAHQEIYSQSAVYIASAHSLKPDYPVYRNALRLVRTMLPLPYLKAGFLTVPPNGNTFAPHADWKRKWFILDQEELKEGKKPEPKLSGLMRRSIQSQGSSAAQGGAAAQGVSAAASIAFPGPSAGSTGAPATPGASEGGEPREAPAVFPIADILSVDTCADLSLPRGGGIVLGLASGPTYLVADDWDTMDSWVDAIRLVYTICVRGRTDELSAVLAG